MRNGFPHIQHIAAFATTSCSVQQLLARPRSERGEAREVAAMAVDLESGKGIRHL
jgi:hypothetical protein